MHNCPFNLPNSACLRLISLSFIFTLLYLLPFSSWLTKYLSSCSFTCTLLLLTSDLSGNYAGLTFKVYLQYFHLVITGKAIMIQGIMIFYWITAIDFLIFYNIFSTQSIVNTIYCQHSNNISIM